MPLNKNIKKILVIGSGPIVIGQAAEFDYAGTQACSVLREEGIEIVLVNSNPATIMTDTVMADKIYIEPLTLKTIERIIEKEKPDSILSGLGGQTGLTLCMQLNRSGFLAKHNVRLLGSSPDAIDKAEDRQIFKDTMIKIGQPVVPSVVVNELSGALKFANDLGYPVIIRPAFTLGGTGGGIAKTEEELKTIAKNGLSLSPITQILVEKSIAGWKEIEFEVMRDSLGCAIAVCSMENLDPVGIHTGDSIVIAPAVTLSNKEYQMLRTAAINIINALEIEGGCNVQFALDPFSFEYAVIEVNPRVSRSSALASKATGYPIAKVSTKIAIGYTLDEIVNAVTGTTYAAFEPSIDYVAVKFPKWPFDKFVYAKKELGTQMKATGEVMAIGDTFEFALMKAIRGAEIGQETLNLNKLEKLDDKTIRGMLHTVTDERIFVLYEALKRGVEIPEIYKTTKVDPWFLNKLLNILNYEKLLKAGPLTKELYVQAKKLGFTDKSIIKFCGAHDFSVEPVYKMVDTCAAEYKAATPYFYGLYEAKENGAENEALPLINKSGKEKIVVLGSGPIRIGQGIEFDYASVHCVRALRKIGYEVIVINNNPETVSTDFDIADRLYFEPLNIEDVLNVIKIEKPIGVIAAFGGGTAIKLTQDLNNNGVKILGTSAESIDLCEDRKKFDELLETLNIKRPEGLTAEDIPEALACAEKLGYPVLMRPSYVLGGQNMIIAFCKEDITEYMEIIMRSKFRSVLIDKYIKGLELEVDAISDSENIFIPGIMEHIERTGIHSGDSIAVYPPIHIDDETAERISLVTQKICTALKIRGIVNIQFVLCNGEIYIIEVNPRASRTVPYISKVTGINICEFATRAALGESLKNLGLKPGIGKIPPYTAVKVPVFSFEKLTDVDTHLGPEMKSTGEVLGIGKNIQEALFKGLKAAGYKLDKSKKGGAFFTVRDSDKNEIIGTAKKFENMGMALYATSGTAEALKNAGMKVTTVNKIYQSPDNNITELLESGKINYIISTSAKGRDPARDSVKIRRKACLLGIPCLTSIDTANAIADSDLSGYSEISTELVNLNNLRKSRLQLKFTKMQGCGNDYIYIDSRKLDINSPESLAVFLSDRHFGVGGDGVVLICESEIADAKMRLFNLDGSEGGMGGNAVRCVGKYLYDNGIVKKKQIKIETLSGVKELSLSTLNGQVFKVKVNMGAPELNAKKIPVKFNTETVISSPIKIDGAEYKITCVNMGNPHCAVFLDDVEDFDIKKIGYKIENNSVFPERANVEFVKVLSRNFLKVRVWERGGGETLSSGTGACAAAVAAVLNGYCDKDTDIKIDLKGGELIVNYSDEGVFLTGDCFKTFEGTVEV